MFQNESYIKTFSRLTIVAKISLREDAVHRIIQFKCPSPRGQWRNQVERRRASVSRTSSRMGVLSALWSQSLYLGRVC